MDMDRSTGTRQARGITDEAGDRSINGDKKPLCCDLAPLGEPATRRTSLSNRFIQPMMEAQGGSDRFDTAGAFDMVHDLQHGIS